MLSNPLSVPTLARPGGIVGPKIDRCINHPNTIPSSYDQEPHNPHINSSPPSPPSQHYLCSQRDTYSYYARGGNFHLKVGGAKLVTLRVQKGMVVLLHTDFDDQIIFTSIHALQIAIVTVSVLLLAKVARPPMPPPPPRNYPPVCW